MMGEYRKVQKTGNSSYIVSLPKEWCKMHNIESGSEVYIEVDETGRLTINPGYREQTKNEFVLSIEDDYPELIFRKLISVYLSGYDTIIVHEKPYLTEKTKSVVNKFVLNTIGLEIVEETSDRIVLQNISNMNELNSEKLLRRLYHILENMVMDTVSVLEKYDENLARDIIERDMHIDRILYSITKQLYMFLKHPSIAMKSDMRLKTIMDIRFAAKYMERMGDHLVNIVSLSPLPEYLGKEISEFLKSMKKNLDDVFYSFVNCRIDNANSIIEDTREKTKNIRMKMDELKCNGSPKVILAYESIYRIGMYITDFAETVMDECIDRNI
ncbi:MAG: PhoU domain-containing protein [Thermoplasmata archaeon]